MLALAHATQPGPAFAAHVEQVLSYFAKEMPLSLWKGIGITFAVVQAARQ